MMMRVTVVRPAETNPTSKSVPARYPRQKRASPSARTIRLVHMMRSAPMLFPEGLSCPTSIATSEPSAVRARPASPRAASALMEKLTGALKAKVRLAKSGAA